MALSKAIQEILKRIPKKNAGQSGKVRPDGPRYIRTPEGQIEFELVDPATLPEFQRPTGPDSGFYIDERSAELARQSARNRWLEFETYKDINRLKYQLHRYEREQKKRRGYVLTFPAEYTTGKRREPKEAAILDVPGTGVATQPSGEFTPTETVLDEPGFAIPDIPDEGLPKDPESEFETCEDLEEKIRAITGLDFSLCGQRNAAAGLYSIGIAANQADRMVHGKGKKHRRRGRR